MVWVKVCGITNVTDAELAVAAGADALGLNFIPISKRYVDRASAQAIIDAVGGRAELVGVVADLELEAARELQQSLGLDRLQLHGSEPPELVSALGAGAFKVIHVATLEDVHAARTYECEPLLVDTKLDGALGGTGKTFDWSLVRGLSAERRVVLAGGLTPDNVARAVSEIGPWGVDVASGTEPAGEPRRKDPERVHAFVSRAKRARG